MNNEEKNLHNIEETGMENNNNISSDNANNNKKDTITNKPLTSRQISNNNLVTFDTLTENERREGARRAGIRSGEVRRARKTATELLTKILAQNLSEDQIEEILGNASVLLGNDTTAYNVMMVKALQGAMSGDVKSQIFIRDTVGDAPISKTEIKQEVLTEDDKRSIESIKNRLLG